MQNANLPILADQEKLRIKREKLRIKAANWRAKNPQKVKEINKRNSEKRKSGMSESDKEKLREKDREYYTKHKEIINAKNKKYYQNNKDKIAIINKKWQDAHPEKVKEIRKGINKRRRNDPVKAAKMNESAQQWRIKNADKIKEYSRKYWAENKEAITERTREKKRAYAKKHIERDNEIKKRSKNKRIQEDPAVKLKIRVSTAIYQCLKAKKGNRSVLEILPYSIKDLMAHLESQFIDGMSWENYGKWHVDHKKPRIAFNYNSFTDPDFLKLWALDNLQPLWAIDNYKKGHKILF